jgi:tRNA (uracil-5-)-methyltransferase
MSFIVISYYFSSSSTIRHTSLLLLCCTKFQKRQIVSMTTTTAAAAAAAAAAAFSWQNTIPAPSLPRRRIQYKLPASYPRIPYRGMSSTGDVTESVLPDTTSLSTTVTPPVSSTSTTTTSDWYSDMDTTTVPIVDEAITVVDTRKVSKKFVAFPFEYHEIVDIRIDTLTNRGWGLGRVDVSDRGEAPVVSTTAEDDTTSGRRRRQRNQQSDGEGETTAVTDSENTNTDMDFIESTPKRWVIMTPNVIPGELVRVRIFRNHRNYSEGDVIEIVEPKVNERIVPQCPLANECGGCQYQHISIQAQRTYKRLSVQQSLAQYGITGVTVSPTLGTDEIFGYRSKLTPHYQTPSKVDGIKQIGTIGFLRQTSRSILDVPSCIIATKAVNEKFQQVRDELKLYPTTRNRGASLLFRQANLEDTVRDVSTDNNEYITTIIHGIRFTYQAGNFFQNNYYVVPIMVDEVVRFSSLPSSRGTNMTHLVDCYCGSGLFALSASHKFHTVVGIEVNQRSVEEATQNAYDNVITNCHFRSASAEYIFNDIQKFPRDTTVVVIDPPRKGCSIDFLQQLYKFSPQRIVYMSCDPQTQARDAQGILDTGRYKIIHIQPFDLFPQTRHIECLIVFERQ